MLRQLCNIQWQVPAPTVVFQSLVIALVLSQIDYCNGVLAGLPANLICLLQLVQNATVWLIFRIRCPKHISDVLVSLHWLCIQERILFKIAVMTYQALNGSAPEHLSSYFTRVTDVPSQQRLRLASSNQLAALPFNVSISKQAFPVYKIR